ncbi:MAG: hypothetical protein ACT4QA_01980 [Panacagrimonas sp.]
MSRPRALLLGVCISALLAGCAYGNKYSYATNRAKVTAEGTGKLVVATSDQRSFIKSGDKAPDFVGLQRGRFGNPFDVRTATGLPLSDDMSESMTLSLGFAGFDAQVVKTVPSESLAAVKTRLLQAKPRRALLLEVREWKSDTLKRAALSYNLSLTVYGPLGEAMGTKAVQGHEDLGGTFFNASKSAGKNVPEAFRRKLEQLLNAPEVQKGLK